MCVRLAILLASTSVAGCSGPERNAERPHAEADDQRFENVRIFGANAKPPPDGISVGRFIRSGSCLLFESEGGVRYNPVITVDASIGRTDEHAPVMVLQGQAVRLNERIRVAGGGSGDVETLTEAQRKCSGSIFVMGELLGEQPSPSPPPPPPPPGRR